MQLTGAEIVIECLKVQNIFNNSCQIKRIFNGK